MCFLTHDFAHGSWKALAAWYQRWQHFQIYTFLVFSFSFSSSSSPSFPFFVSWFEGGNSFLFSKIRTCSVNVERKILGLFHPWRADRVHQAGFSNNIKKILILRREYMLVARGSRPGVIPAHMRMINLLSQDAGVNSRWY